MSHLGLFCAVVLAGVFAVSAREKTGRIRFRVFAAGAGPLELVARRWRTAAAVAVAAAEVVVVAAFGGGLVLVVAGLGRMVLAGAFVVSAALLAVFTGAIGVLLRRGERAPCHCFGVQDAPLGPVHLVRNVVLFAIAVTGALSPAGAYDAGAVALAVVSGLVVAVLVVRLDDLADLFSSPRPARPLR
jgi:hypothetical protein